MEVMLVAYLKKLLFEQIGHFDLGPRLSHPVSQLWISCKNCFTILHNERSMVFLKETLLYSEQFGHFGTKMVCCLLHFESTLRFFYWFYSKNRTKRYMKLFLVVF